MAEINNYVAAGGYRSVNASSPYPGFPAPSLDNREASRERTGCATHTLAGLVPGPAHGDLAHVERNIPVVADAIWRIRDRLTNVATRLSAFSSDKAPPGWLVARSVSSGSKHLVAATKTADARARKSGECRFRGRAGERRRNM